MKRLILAIAIMAALPFGIANAACGGRVGVQFGETLEDIAARCHINVERLKQANPGLTGTTLRNGTFIIALPPQLPSPSRKVRGNRSISGANRPYDAHMGLPAPRPNMGAVVRPVVPAPSFN